MRGHRQLSRAEVRQLSASARTGDAAAARRLLAHSIALGHKRLSLRRFYFAQALGVTGLKEFEPFCERVKATLSATDLQAMARQSFEMATRARRNGGFC